MPGFFFRGLTDTVCSHIGHLFPEFLGPFAVHLSPPPPPCLYSYPLLLLLTPSGFVLSSAALSSPSYLLSASCYLLPLVVGIFFPLSSPPPGLPATSFRIVSCLFSTSNLPLPDFLSSFPPSTSLSSLLASPSLVISHRLSFLPLFPSALFHPCCYIPLSESIRAHCTHIN